MLDLLDGKLVAGKSNKKATAKDMTWAKIIECIRKHATSLHSALRNGWKCNCMVPHLAALRLQEREGENSSTCFTLTFTSSISTKSTISVRKVMITVKDTTNEKGVPPATPQSTPAQDWYLNKLRQNIESGEISKEKTLSIKGSNSSSLSSKHYLNASDTKSGSIMTLSSIQGGHGTQILIKESRNK
jgi:hypothetical protein